MNRMTQCLETNLSAAHNGRNKRPNIWLCHHWPLRGDKTFSHITKLQSLPHKTISPLYLAGIFLQGEGFTFCKGFFRLISSPPQPGERSTCAISEQSEKWPADTLKSPAPICTEPALTASYYISLFLTKTQPPPPTSTRCSVYPPKKRVTRLFCLCRKLVLAVAGPAHSEKGKRGGGRITTQVGTVPFFSIQVQSFDERATQSTSASGRGVGSAWDRCIVSVKGTNYFCRGFWAL